MDKKKRSQLVKITKAMELSIKALKELTKIVKALDKEKRKKRECWVREINRDRNYHGYYEVTYLPMKRLDHGQFRIYSRMSVPLFDNLLTLFAPEVEKHSLNHPIEPQCRLAILLLYLSQGTTVQEIAWSWKMGKETVRSIILESADALWNALSPFYVCEPNEEDYKRIENDFWTMWNFPNCIGAIDGKHIALRCPPNSGSQFFNYKKYHSIVLMAACDARYCFTHIDVGAYGSQSDGGIFQQSVFGKRILRGLNLPPDRALPGSDDILPRFFVGDQAFPLANHLMRPYPGVQLPPNKEKFNNRLSRARRVIENAFGILVARWQILQNTLKMHPENAEKIVLVCVLLHNYIMLNNDQASHYCPENYADWQDEDGLYHEGLWHSEVTRELPSQLWNQISQF